MERDVLIICKRCFSEHPVSEMKYDNSGDNLICTGCYGQLYENKSGERVHQSADLERINYACSSCGFKFSRSREFKFQGLCFNCGQSSVKPEKRRILVKKNSDC